MMHTFDAGPRKRLRSMHVQASDRRGSTAALLCSAALLACVLACSGDGGGDAEEPGPLDVTVTPIQPRPPVQAAPAEEEPGDSVASGSEPSNASSDAESSNAAPSGDDPADPASASDPAVDTAGDAELSFATDVWPIFNGNCGPCHETLRQGGHNVGSDDVEISFEAAVQNERLILRDLGAGAMPPGCSSVDGEGCVPDADIDVIRAWYDAGRPR